ncbi:hypothetical protein Thein_2230 [Thermodesulfatator indicus DSM 15286]|uniref:Uncharacterized protein n=1 Tax=Thermodesulfatator indicus (strain DSM 15286 / JCM 11887 / CIR29812) TaxID=667014 RepID=F8AE32_THEID|nr:hypothetical protein [Thermodesulfatator indicus]AEH46078.1 hypothetical protein Thein_2230 [Thermodesulfatator indicus DSM 15286]
MSRIFILLMALVIFSSSQALAFKLPSYQEVCALLTDLQGWQAENCSGMNMNTPMGEIVTAERSYKKGNYEISVMVIHGIQATQFWQPFAYVTEVDTPENYSKLTTVDGFKVGISHEKQTNSGSVVVLLNEKDSMAATIFVVQYNDMSWKDGLRLARQFDWKKIEKAFK